jgi:hypothetical protein
MGESAHPLSGHHAGRWGGYGEVGTGLAHGGRGSRRACPTAAELNATLWERRAQRLRLDAPPP